MDGLDAGFQKEELTSVDLVSYKVQRQSRHSSGAALGRVEY